MSDHAFDRSAGLLVAAACAFAALTTGACQNGEPEPTYDQTPLYRTETEDGPTSGERGGVMITEINFAGSVANDGTHDWDDNFIELRNKYERPVNISNWRLVVRGDVNETYRIPENSDPIATNEFFVIARKKRGAFAEAADVFIPDLELGRQHVQITLLDADERLIGSAGSADHRVFAGGWDTHTVRSMERVQLIFNNPGRRSRSWHAYSANDGFETIRSNYRNRTLASPGAVNSTNYSGSTANGDFN